jgi:hypothetical protein
MALAYFKGTVILYIYSTVGIFSEIQEYIHEGVKPVNQQLIVPDFLGFIFQEFVSYL